MSTPLRISKGIKKIWEDTEGAPNSERVVQDVHLAFEAHKKVYEVGGRMVPGLVNRNGHRARPEGNRPWGGKRVKSYEISNDPWLEAGAKAVTEDRKLLTNAKYYELVTDQ